MKSSKSVDDRVYNNSSSSSSSFSSFVNGNGNNVKEFEFKDSQSSRERWNEPDKYNPIAAKTFTNLSEACKYVKVAIQMWLQKSPDLDVSQVMKINILDNRVPTFISRKSLFAKSLKLVAVFDLDETVLHYYGDGMHDCKIPKCVRSLLSFLRENDVQIFFITARRENMREETEKTLDKLGIWNPEIDKLFLKPDDFPRNRSSVFKSRMRKQIQKNNYFIMLNVGDQFSDLIPVHYWKQMIERMERDLPEQHLLRKILISFPSKMAAREKLKNLASATQVPVMFYKLEKDIPFALKLPQQDFFTI
jgi:predicted secreted acid phosphatase